MTQTANDALKARWRRYLLDTLRASDAKTFEEYVFVMAKRYSDKVPRSVNNLKIADELERRAFNGDVSLNYDQYAALTGDWGWMLSAVDQCLLLEKVLPFIRRVDVADIGCGPCALPIFLRSEGLIGKVTGIDRSAKMCEQALRNASVHNVDITIVNRSADELPFGDERFPLVLCTETIHWLPHYSRAIREAARIVENGGRLLIEYGTDSGVIKITPDQVVTEMTRNGLDVVAADCYTAPVTQTPKAMIVGTKRKPHGIILAKAF